MIHVDPPPPSSFNPHVPPKLDAVIARALGKHPDARYQTATDLLEDLRVMRARAQVDDRVSTQPISIKPATASTITLATISKALRRPRVFIPAVVAAVAVAIAVFLVAPPGSGAKPHPPPPEALRWYNQGRSALRDGLYYKASNALQSAVDASGEFALAHASLAEAMAELDYSEKAGLEIIRARSLVRDLSRLPSLDEYYLQAITDTVFGDFDHAAESYQQIVAQAQDSEKGYAFVDLGRAYEKNDRTDKALDSYQKASEIVPDDPAAFLRLGVLYGRRQETPLAMEAFQKAESIYQRLENFEGVAEVFYQRGALFNNLGMLDEARAQLEQVLAIARDNVHQRIRTLLQLSKVYYVDGKTTQARQYATDAITMAQVNRMENLSTGGLIELGRAFEFGGDYDQAEQYFNNALEFAEQYKGRHNEAKALLSLGRLHIDQHDADKGLPYVDQALAFYDRSGYRKETSEALIQMARGKEPKRRLQCRARCIRTDTSNCATNR